MITKSEVIDVLKEIVDPELNVDLWTLGLIYSINFEGSTVNIKMTFTSIGCPFGPKIVAEVREKVNTIPGVEKTEVEVVFDPPWQPPDDLKALIGLF